MHEMMICLDCYDSFTMSSRRKLCGVCRKPMEHVMVDSETVHHIFHHRLQHMNRKSSLHPCKVSTCIGSQCSELTLLLLRSKVETEE